MDGAKKLSFERLRGSTSAFRADHSLLGSPDVGREIELRRHTDANGDVLSPEGVAAALEIGARLEDGYDLAVSTGAQRGLVVEPGLRSQDEDRGRAAYQTAGSGALGALRDADPELVAEDSQRLGAALRRLLDGLPDGGRALAVGYSPTNEAAVLGLIGEILGAARKGRRRPRRRGRRGLSGRTPQVDTPPSSEAGPAHATLMRATGWSPSQ